MTALQLLVVLAMAFAIYAVYLAGRSIWPMLIAWFKWKRQQP